MSAAELDAVEGLRVRPLEDDDLAGVMEIERASFTTPWRQTTFESLLRRGDTDLLCATLGEELVGYAVCWTVLDQAELGNVAVAGTARGRGIGGALVDAVLRRVAERGARECFLEVRESNVDAQSVYRNRGFEVVGRRRAYYSQPREDALVMRREVRQNS